MDATMIGRTVVDIATAVQMQPTVLPRRNALRAEVRPIMLIALPLGRPEQLLSGGASQVMEAISIEIMTASVANDRHPSASPVNMVCHHPAAGCDNEITTALNSEYALNPEKSVSMPKFQTMVYENSPRSERRSIVHSGLTRQTLLSCHSVHAKASAGQITADGIAGR